MNRLPETETAFGRPARWSAALPALVVGCGAFLMAVYGTWWLPSRLHPHYSRALQTTQDNYQKLSSSPSPSMHWNLGEAAGDLDVIYNRLVELERADPKRYWQWAEFLQAHADFVLGKVLDPAVSLQPELRQQFLDQAHQFQTKAREIFSQLAVGQSELSVPALLRVVRWKYQQGIAQFGVRDAPDLIAELRKLPTGPSVNPDERMDAQWLLVHLLIEQAWLSPTAQRLLLTPEPLDEAWQLCQAHLSSSSSTTDQRPWKQTAKLLAAFLGKPENDADTANSSVDSASQPASEASGTAARGSSIATWQQELVELQGAAVDADWQAIAIALARDSEQDREALLGGLARTVCRLACSPHAKDTNSWAEQIEIGLLLTAQIAPHLPEFAELLWSCARLQAGGNNGQITLSPQVPQVIARGQNAMLKHSVSALSAAVANQPQVARTHLELIRRAQANLSLVARTCLWRGQLVASQVQATEANRSVAPGPEPALTAELTSLSQLMSAACELESESGLNWFTLGTLQFHARQYSAMRDSLARAQKLLGEVPAIEQMLEASRGLP